MTLEGFWVFRFLSGFFKSNDVPSYFSFWYRLEPNVKLFTWVRRKGPTKSFPRKQNFIKRTTSSRGWTRTIVNGNTKPLCSPTVHPTGVLIKRLWKCTVLITKRKIWWVLRISLHFTRHLVKSLFDFCINFSIFMYAVRPRLFFLPYN